jgi:hypothetical protein
MSVVADSLKVEGVEMKESNEIVDDFFNDWADSLCRECDDSVGVVCDKHEVKEGQ